MGERNGNSSLGDLRIEASGVALADSLIERQRYVSMKLHFDCVFYYVFDMERAIRFYRDILGLKLVSRDIVARFDIDGVLFEVVPARHDGVQHHTGNARLCLRVDNVEEALKELQAKGVRTGQAESKGTGKLGCFWDPDGNEICLWEEIPQTISGG